MFIVHCSCSLFIVPTVLLSSLMMFFFHGSFIKLNIKFALFCCDTCFCRIPTIGPNKPQAVVNPSQVIWSSPCGFYFLMICSPT